MSETVKNIWSLKKDSTVKSILILLQLKVGPESFMLLNEHELNDKAVRIIHPPTQGDLSAYIYSYAQPAGHYGLDLEFPYLIKTQANDQSIRLDNLAAEEVIKKVIDHLQILT